jgi:hypothetical protein
LTPIEVTELPMLNDVKPVQPEKAAPPISVTEFGISTEVKLEQPLKAELPIVVTEFPRVTEVKFLQLLNADPLISVIELLIIIDVIESAIYPFAPPLIFCKLGTVAFIRLTFKVCTSESSNYNPKKLKFTPYCDLVTI